MVLAVQTSHRIIKTSQTSNMKKLSLFSLIVLVLICSCNNKSESQITGAKTKETKAKTGAKADNYKEGSDYLVFERVRFIDKEGFKEPTEAYSLLFPKGWSFEGGVGWNHPGTACAGTFQKMTAKSADNKYSFQLLPDRLYNWSSAGQYGPDGCAKWSQPMDAETYLRQVLSKEMNGEVLTVTTNEEVVERMSVNNASVIAEMQSYGAGRMEVKPTAINARMKLKEGQEAMITLAVVIMQTEVPNVYGGPSTMIYTTSARPTIFKYPSAKSEEAQKSFAVIMSSVRTNPGWKDAVDGFWKQVRQQRNVTHRAQLRAIDAQTAANTRGHNKRMNDIKAAGEANTRNWEARQSTNDRIHTEFIKTIRGVENFRDETGKYEMTSGYDHVWSRGDGSSFIMSNSPNFDPSSVFQDQQWKQMKKVQ